MLLTRCFSDNNSRSNRRQWRTATTAEPSTLAASSFMVAAVTRGIHGWQGQAMPEIPQYTGIQQQDLLKATECKHRSTLPASCATRKRL